MSIRVSVEGVRGCGRRKEGGLYLVSGELNEPCSRLPLEVGACPTCGEGVKPSRGYTWIDPTVLFPATEHDSSEHNAVCPLGLPAEGFPADAVQHRCGERSGLIWIGETHYPTVEDFMAEAVRMGISRRIVAVPRGFKIGETWVFLGHRKALKKGYRDPETEQEFESLSAAMEAGATDAEQVYAPGIATLFRPTAIEYVVRPEDEEDEEFLDSLRERGIEPVKVIADDEQTSFEAA